jgi:hypothetical protein
LIRQAVPKFDVEVLRRGRGIAPQHDNMTNWCVGCIRKNGDRPPHTIIRQTVSAEAGWLG